MKPAISGEERARRLNALGVRPAAHWCWTDADIVRGERRLRSEIRKINATPVGTIERGPDGKTRYVAAKASVARCHDCGEEGERTGHQTCQYPQDR